MSSDERLTRLVRELEQSIEHAIASSTRVEKCLARVNEEGYELSLLLEATLAFAPKGERVREAVGEAHGTTPAEGDGRMAPRLSSTDKQFLRSLKIAFED